MVTARNVFYHAYIIEIFYACSKTVYISKDGFDRIECGSIASACLSLNYVLKYFQLPLDIELVTRVGANNVFEYCTNETIYGNVTIKTYGQQSAVIACEADVTLEHAVKGKRKIMIQTNILFLLTEGTYHFDHIYFNNGGIILWNGQVTMTKCVFNNTRTYLMGTDIFTLYMEKRVTRFEMLLDIPSFIFGEFSNGMEKSWDRFHCNFTSITYDNVTWLEHAQHTFMTVDTVYSNSILGVCRRIKVDILNSYLADRIVWLHGLDTLCMQMQFSSFIGLPSGQILQGGLKLYSACSMYMRIEDCEFSQLRFSDLLQVIVANDRKSIDQLETAALSIKTIRLPFLEKYDMCAKENSKQCHLFFPEIIIINTEFRQNMGGLSLMLTPTGGKYKNNFPDSVLIRNCSFVRNEVIRHGAGIFVNTDDKVRLSIQNSVFKDNRAGVLAFQTPVIFLDEKIFAAPIILRVADYKIATESLIILHTYRYTDDKNMTTPIHFNIQGSGGGIYLSDFNCFKSLLKYGLSVEIIETVFINNSANVKAGSLYVGLGSQVLALDNQFSGTIKRGQAVIESNGDITLIRNNVTIIDNVHEAPALLTKDIRITNISIECPTNNQLTILNTSYSIIQNAYITPLGSVSALKRTGLSYICRPCQFGTYSMEYGFIKHSVSGAAVYIAAKLDLHKPPSAIPPPPALFARYTHEIIHHNFECKPCPYGAFCMGQVKSKLNYWGRQYRGNLLLYQCPNGYCCKKARCNSYNECAAGPDGILCGRCRSGYSEALFSLKCIHNSECTQQWMPYIGFFLVIFYALFLLFQNDIKNFIYSAPLNSKTRSTKVEDARDINRVWSKRMQAMVASQNKDPVVYGGKLQKSPEISVHKIMTSSRAVSALTSVEKTDMLDLKNPAIQDEGKSKKEGGIFIILSFYYFQDASLVYVQTMYREPDSFLVDACKKIVGGIFKFQLNVLHFAKEVCFVRNVTPVTKVILILSFLPVLLLLLFTLYVLSRKLSRPSSKNSHKWKALKIKSSLAIVLAAMFSYQKLATSMLVLLYCIPFENQYVLKIDGNITCLQFWQGMVLTYCITSVIPFGFYLCFAPSFLADGALSMNEFFFGCLFPLPMLLYKITQKCESTKRKKRKQSDEVELVMKLLQGPYRDLSIQIFSYNLTICYSGVVLIRRLALILTYTVPLVLNKLIVMFVISVIALTVESFLKPCKERRSNIACTVSNTALVVVCMVNLIRAAFIGAEYIPTGPVEGLSNALDMIEDCLLFWIPLCGIGLIICVVVFRIAVNKCIP